MNKPSDSLADRLPADQALLQEADASTLEAVNGGFQYQVPAYVYQLLNPGVLAALNPQPLPPREQFVGWW
jgi:hypothetical protein